MGNEPRDHRPSAPARGHEPYPLPKIVAVVARAELDGVVTAEEVPGLDEPLGGSVLQGLLTRLTLSLGDDLDECEQARGALLDGHALILVPVHDDAEQERAQAARRQHGGQAMHAFGRWTITTLAGDAH